MKFIQGLFNMTSDSNLFCTREQLEFGGYENEEGTYLRNGQRYVSMYEAKMIHQYDHRWATYGADEAVYDMSTSEKQDARASPLGRYWVPESSLDERWPTVLGAWQIVWRGISRSKDVRTAMAAAVPRLPGGGNFDMFVVDAANHAALALAIINCLPFDYVVRQKLSGPHLQFAVMAQLPFPPVETFRSMVPWSPLVRLDDWIVDRVNELVYTSWDIKPFAVDMGDDGSPFIWNEDRRALIRAELDATFFWLYRLERDEVEHVLTTFPIVRRRDEAKYGEYRTARVVLDMYDAMSEAANTGVPYQTVLDPPPSEGPRHPDPERVA